MPSSVAAAALGAVIAESTITVGMAGMIHFSLGFSMSAFASSVVLSGLSADLPAGGA